MVAGSLQHVEGFVSSCSPFCSLHICGDILCTSKRIICDIQARRLHITSICSLLCAELVQRSFAHWMQARDYVQCAYTPHRRNRKMHRAKREHKPKGAMALSTSLCASNFFLLLYGARIAVAFYVHYTSLLLLLFYVFFCFSFFLHIIFLFIHCILLMRALFYYFTVFRFYLL